MRQRRLPILVAPAILFLLTPAGTAEEPPASLGRNAGGAAASTTRKNRKDVGAWTMIPSRLPPC
jgi:hypothetical protein